MSIEDARARLFRRAQNHVGFEIKLIDIDESDQYSAVINYQMDFGVVSVDTGAILFRSYYNRFPMVTFAGAFGDWICPDDDLDFIPF